MAIVRLDPFRELAAMQDRINRIFGDASRRDDDLFTRGDWVPAVDILENDKHEIVIKAELPGMKKEEIDLRLENNTLTIRGERKRATDARDEQYHRVERAYGSFSRSFSLPTSVDHTHGHRRLRRWRAHDHAARQGRGQAPPDPGAGQRLRTG